MSKVLVAGVGNIFRCDDGFGSAVAARLLEDSVPGGATVVDYGIRGVHLAFDLADHVDTLILVDTVPDAGEPGAVSVLEVPAEAFGTAAFDAHGLDPSAVFRSLGALVEAPPRTFVVGCQPLSLDDGIGLSDPVAAAVPIAADMVLELLRQRLGVAG